MKQNGTVKRFNDRKGYGFIECESGGDAFVHYSDIADQDNGRKTLKDGQEVIFDLVQTAKGFKAVNVVAV